MRTWLLFVWKLMITAETERRYLSSLQVDVLQVAVVEIQIAAVSLLISEVHHVWRESSC